MMSYSSCYGTLGKRVPGEGTEDPWQVRAKECYKQREEETLQAFAYAMFPMWTSLLHLLNWLPSWGPHFSFKSHFSQEVFSDLNWNGCVSSVFYKHKISCL